MESSGQHPMVKVASTDVSYSQEINETAKHLFSTFVEEEIIRQGVENCNGYTRGCIDETLNHSLHGGDCDGPAYRTPYLGKLGKDLRLLADEFSRSKERVMVHEKAQGVDLNSMSKENFTLMLQELFQGGISRSRLVVLFFFCSDVAIRALKTNAFSCFRKFILWALTFIMQTISKWVEKNGGWGKVLSHSVNLAYKGSVIIIGLAIIIIGGYFLVKRKM